MLWGDEIEYLVVTYADGESRVRLSLRQADILECLNNSALAIQKNCETKG